MKILIVRVGRVGDMVMITPALNSLLDKYPMANFTLLTSPDGKRVLNEYHTRISDIIIYDRKKLLPYLLRKRMTQLIANGNFDHIFCFESKTNFYSLFNHSNAKIHGLSIVDGEVLHFSTRCLNLTRSANKLEEKEYYVKLPVSKSGELKSNTLMSELGINYKTFLIGLHPSCSGLTQFRWRSMDSRKNKLWPVEYWSKLGQMLHQYGLDNNYDLKVLIDLLPEERALGKSIVDQSHGSIVFQCPPPDFERYKATLQRLDLLITPDTGPMHVAAAVGTNIVALFSDRDPNDSGPYVLSEQFQVLRAEKMRPDASGIAAITPETVFLACKKFFPHKSSLSSPRIK